jgi:hypothetical protein
MLVLAAAAAAATAVATDVATAVDAAGHVMLLCCVLC